MADNMQKGQSDYRPVAADEVGSVLYQRVKVVWGADNTCTDASAAAPLPVNIATTSTVVIGDVSLAVRATTTNTVSGFHRVSTADANAINVKSSAGRFYGASFYNDNAAARYLKLHNTNGTPTAGAAVVRTFAIPPKGRLEVQMLHGHFFATGIAMTLVTGAADNDTTGVAAGEITGEIWYA